MAIGSTAKSIIIEITWNTKLFMPSCCSAKSIIASEPIFPTAAAIPPTLPLFFGVEASDNMVL